MTAYNFTLTEKQAGFLYDTNPLAIYRGGLGAGKTKALVIWANNRAHLKRRIILTEPTYGMINDVLVTEFYDLFGEYEIPYHHNKSEQYIDVGGGRIYMRSGETPHRMRGINADDFGMDEAPYQSYDVYRVGLSRMNRRKGFTGGQARLVGTPKGREWSVELAEKSHANVYTQSTFANPFLSKEYKDSLVDEYTTEYALQELYGQVVDFSAGVIRSSWFQNIDAYPVLPRSCRSWDLAFTTKKSSDFSASAKLTLDSDNVYAHDIFRVKKAWGDTREIIIRTAHEDGRQVPIVIEAVGGQIALIDDLKRTPELNGFKIHAFNPKGDKLNRAMGWASKSERGRFFLLPNARKDYFYNECNQFTADDTHAHDDCIDAVSQAYNFLSARNVVRTGNIIGV